MNWLNPENTDTPLLSNRLRHIDKIRLLKHLLVPPSILAKLFAALACNAALKHLPKHGEGGYGGGVANLVFAMNQIFL